VASHNGIHRALHAPHRLNCRGRWPRNDPAVTLVLLGTDGIRSNGGLVAATLLTLFFLPALYAAWFKVKPD